MLSIGDAVVNNSGFLFHRKLGLVVDDGQLKESRLVSRMKEAREKETKAARLDLVMCLGGCPVKAS